MHGTVAAQAYATAWQGPGIVEARPPHNVKDALRADVTHRVLPWPEIDRNPVPVYHECRIVKAHPLTFPAGCGDFRRPRLRSDFNVSELLQHVFRYFDGRLLSSTRGQRAVWSCFNTAMQELSRKAGGLMFKRVGAEVLTEADLKCFLASRGDVVTKLGSLGTDLLSTPMQMKRAGADLE